MDSLIPAPALPAAWIVRWGIAFAWPVVLAAGGAWVGWRWVQWREEQRAEQYGYVRQSGRDVMAVCAAVAAVLGLLPGIWGASHWLGLAFLMPSWVTIFLCGWYLKRLLWVPRPPKAVHARLRPPAVRAPPAVPLTLGMQVAAVLAGLLGWWAVLDAMLAFPVALYPLGFSPWMPVALLLAIGLPWLLWPGLPSRHPLPWMVAAALLLHGLLRLPSGNALDAVLDPCLWVAAQLYLVRSVWQARRPSQRR